MEQNKFCIVCFKPELTNFEDGVSGEETAPVCKNVFDRFVKHILGERSTQDLPNLTENAVIGVCNACESVVGKYCDLYFELESVRMRLRWQLERLRLVMKHAGKVPSRIGKFKETMLKNGNSENLDSILRFRQAIYGKCSSRCRRKNPVIQLKRLTNYMPVQLSSDEEAVHSPDKKVGGDEIVIKPEEDCISNTTNVETEVVNQVCILQFKEETEDFYDRNIAEDSFADETIENNSEFCVGTPAGEEEPIPLIKPVQNEEKSSKHFLGSSPAKRTLHDPLIDEFPTDQKALKRSLREKFKCTTCSKVFVTKLKLRDHETKENCVDSTRDDNDDDMIETNSRTVQFSNAKICNEDCKDALNYSNTSSEDSSSSDEEHVGDAMKSKATNTTRNGKNKERFPCSIDTCTKVFSRQYLLDRHLKLHGTFSCHSCDFKTDNADSIFDHEKSAHVRTSKGKGSKIECPRCSRLFCRVTRTKRHFFSEHLHLEVDKILFREQVPSGNFPCSSCDKVFKKQSHLDLHVKLHGDFNCSFCDFKTDTADNLLNHEWTEHSTNQEGTSRTKCSRCPAYLSMKECRQTQRLQHFCKHLGIEYSGERKCPICGMGFAPDRADRRIRLHIQEVHDTTGMDPESIFKCDVCNAPFRSDTSRMVHKVRVHKQSNLECTICKRKFYRQRALVMHMRKLHGKPTQSSSNDSIFQCPLSDCEKKFFAKFSLECHMRKHNKEMIVCSICDKRCMNANGLRIHMKVHAIPKIGDNVKKRFSCVCDLCGKMFSGYARHDAEQRLKTHLESKMHSTDRPGGLSDSWKYSCEVCGKLCQNTFKLEEHMRIHLKEKPFICAACGRAFSIKFNLKRHMKLVHKQHMPAERTGRKRSKKFTFDEDDVIN